MALTLIAAAAISALAALCVVGTLSGRLPGPSWLATVLGCAGGGAAVLLATMRSGNRSPGGVDNGGSLAVLLELARTLPDRLHDGVELVFLSTGAEEDHMVGAMRWLDAAASDLRGRTVYCLNLDGAGAPGRVVVIERFGLGRRFSPEMSLVARVAAKALGIPVRGILMPPGLGIDAIPFAHRGFDCLTLASGSLGRATLSVHSARDIPEHLDPATLERIFFLARQIVLELSSEQAGRRLRNQDSVKN
jgi:Zn-dependent M28 family amino/carboxypeptidase